MAISRRSFLKYTALTAGTSILAESSFLGAKAKERESGEKAKYVPSVCEICFWKCGLVAKVVDGKVVKLEGNPLHPQSRGKLCGRGQAGLGLLYDKDRLKTPMIRTGPRGENQYKTASWDAALDYAAEQLNAVKEKHGAESVALFAHGTGTGYMTNLLHAFGSHNEAHPSYSQCKGTRETMYIRTFGEMPAASCERVDLARSRVIVLFGTHLGENMHNSQVQDFAEAVQNGARIIVVDPRYSTAASKASMWLPIKPGTDQALQLAWINLIISEGLFDKEYVEKYTTGFEQLKEGVKKYTPAWAAGETELPEAMIIEAGRELGRYRPNVCVHPGRQVCWYGNDSQRVRANAILNAILGTWGREGGIWLAPKAKLPKVTWHPEYPEPDEDAVGYGGYPFADAQLTNVLRDVTISGKPYPIKAWMLIGTNLVKTLPNRAETLEAINNLDFMLAVDVMPMDTAMLADVVLPAATYLERDDDIMVFKTKEVGIGLRQPVVQPMYDSKPPWWIAKQLCNRLGLGEYVEYETLEEKNRKQAALWNVDYDELSDKGYISIPGTFNPYITPDNPVTFKTPSGKIELYSEALEDEDFDPIPQYEPVEQPPAGEYRLLFGRSPVHTFARTANNEWLWELHKENDVWINSKEAARLGVKNGEYVILINQDGVESNRIRAKVTERIRQDCVYMAHGFGAISKGLSRAYMRGADSSHLITRYKIDPMTGSTGLRVNFVKIKKA
jgi:thiosulfate reductase/polysulfide reductase chain A